MCFIYRHRSRKRRPFSRYAARHRINSVYRDKSFSAGVNSNLADASALEEKLEVLADLKIQMRGKKEKFEKKENKYIFFFFRAH
jgi:hypothetical protein